jgi:cell wall-associated NlpC family hydrolase
VKSTLFAIVFALGFSSALAGSYTVQPKDTLYSIAKKFNSSVAELQKLNNLSVNSVNVGQVLIVPDPQKIHVVTAKETMFSIAKRYGVTVKAMLEANKLSTPDVKIGQRLTIPNSSVTQLTAQTTSSSAKPNSGNPGKPQTSSTVAKPNSSSPPKLPTLNTAPKPQISNSPAITNSSSPSKPVPATIPKPTVSLTKPETAPKPNQTAPAPAASPSPQNPPPDAIVTPAQTSSSSLPARPTSTASLKPPSTGNVKPATSSANSGSVLPSGRGTDAFIAVPVMKNAPLPNLSVPPAAPPSQSTVTNTSSSNTANQSLPEAGTDTPELIHTVVAGETLYRIALRYNVSLESIRAANNLSSDAISAGQQIKIPVIATTVSSPSNPSFSPSNSSLPDVREVSQRYLGVTYRYGGTNPSAGLDCSGFVQIVFAELGLKLPRTSALQFQAGIAVDRENLTEGDLVFFDTLGRGVSHVGIYLGDDQFIHAASNPGKVTISSLSEKYWQPKYLGARRVLTDD